MDAPPPANRSFPLMDTCRALAALAVVAGHSYPGTGPALFTNLAGQNAAAVQVFFGISGFLLFRPYLVALAGQTAFPGTLRFYMRRALRIIPCFWLALTLVALVFGSTYAPDAFWERWWVFYGFGQVYLLSGNYHGLAVAWSLGTEVGFYLVLPFIALAVRRLTPALGWTRAAMVPIAAMLVLGPVIHLLNTIPMDVGVVRVVQRLTYSFPGEANYFAIGMLLAVVSVRVAGGAPVPAVLRRLAARPRLTLLAAAVVILFTANVPTFYEPIALPFVGVLSVRLRFVGSDLLIAVFVLLVLLPAALDERLGRSRSPSPVTRVLAYVAMVSYGLYLWHLPLLGWLAGREPVNTLLHVWPWYVGWPATTLVAAAAGTAVASASWYLVERPILRLKPRRRDWPVAPAPQPATGVGGGD